MRGIRSERLPQAINQVRSGTGIVTAGCGNGERGDARTSIVWIPAQGFARACGLRLDRLRQVIADAQVHREPGTDAGQPQQ